MFAETFGIEEEYLLLDSETGEPADHAEDLIERMPQLKHRAEHEFLSSQLETSTHVCKTADEAYESLRLFRATASKEAEKLGIVIAGIGLPPRCEEEANVLAWHKRYQSLGKEIREVARDIFVTGTHVHVGIPSADAGVDALSRIARWAPVLLAMTANSPWWQMHDTGFASWRHMKGLTMPIAGYPPAFRDGNDYAKSLEIITESGLVLDAGAMSWVARLSQNFPTLELRVADAQLHPEDAVCFALVVRALVGTAIQEFERRAPRHDYPRGIIDAALWLGARNGLETNLVDPLTGMTSFAKDALDQMITYVRPHLEHTGDLARVEGYIDRLNTHGSPAHRQRVRYAEGGLEGLLDLYREGSRGESLPMSDQRVEAVTGGSAQHYRDDQGGGFHAEKQDTATQRS